MNSDLRGSIFRILRFSLLILTLIGLAMWLRSAFTAVESEQAVINAEIIQIRTPIGGEIEMTDIRPGTVLQKGDLLFKVKNARFGDRESSAQFNEMQNNIELLTSELLGAKENLVLLGTTRDRSRRLYQSQLIARMQMEEDDERFVSAQRLVAAKEEQLERSRERLKELAQQRELQKESIVVMPMNGLIWSVVGKMGEQIEANKPVLEVINPDHIWVDAFFAERYADDLKPGLPARVESLDSSSAWHGSLSSVRAGVGRLDYDTSVAVPPPELAKRQIAVRVESDWQQPFSSVEFFGVGRSVRVAFNKTGERTVGDALKERLEKALSKGGATASIERAP